MSDIKFKITYDFRIVNEAEDFCKFLNEFNEKNEKEQIIDWKIFDKTKDGKYTIIYKKKRKIESFYY